jgi:hypothetical protein
VRCASSHASALPNPVINSGRRISYPASSKFQHPHSSTRGTVKTSHAAGHRRWSAESLSNSRLRASFPALLAGAMV